MNRHAGRSAKLRTTSVLVSGSGHVAIVPQD